ncbi:MAG: hypothetical protein K8L91_24220 [Anaerolineae bacterium]|nr:hypothetical protein [Anaerolineae bacterium]
MSTENGDFVPFSGLHRLGFPASLPTASLLLVDYQIALKSLVTMVYSSIQTTVRYDRQGRSQEHPQVRHGKLKIFSPLWALGYGV